MKDIAGWISSKRGADESGRQRQAALPRYPSQSEPFGAVSSHPFVTGQGLCLPVNAYSKWHEGCSISPGRSLSVSVLQVSPAGSLCPKSFKITFLNYLNRREVDFFISVQLEALNVRNKLSCQAA